MKRICVLMKDYLKTVRGFPLHQFASLHGTRWFLDRVRDTITHRT